MHFIKGTSRSQLQFSCLNDTICEDNAVRLIDGFVDHLDLSALGITTTVHKAEGRPPFHPSVLLKLYLYGYLNRIRSSRRLQKECERNVEVRWLLQELVPNYHTIADYRKDYPKALKALFKLFVLFLDEQELLSGELIGVDGSKFRGQNSKKNNYNRAKIDRHLAYINTQSEAYLKELEEVDNQEANEAETLSIKKQHLQQKLQKLKERTAKYQQLEEQLKASGEPQISTTDPDSRALPVGGSVVAVGYNVQTAVDEKHKLVVVCEATNETDVNALSGVALQAKEILSAEELTVLADTGYHNAASIVRLEKENITTLVAPGPYVNSSKKMQPPYYTENFCYDEGTDTYLCPKGKVLSTTGQWHEKKRKNGHVAYRFKKYRTPACATCAMKSFCTAREKGGREIERSEHQEAVERNNQRVLERKDNYKKRQAICEHPFGTIKRSWGYSYTLVREKEKVGGEMALIFLCYNLRRTMSILGVKNFIEKLKCWIPPYEKASCLCEEPFANAYRSQKQTLCIWLPPIATSKKAA
jgi:transposase/IS5 family transposase